MGAGGVPIRLGDLRSALLGEAYLGAVTGHGRVEPRQLPAGRVEASAGCGGSGPALPGVGRPPPGPGRSGDTDTGKLSHKALREDAQTQRMAKGDNFNPKGETATNQTPEANQSRRDQGEPTRKVGPRREPE